MSASRSRAVRVDPRLSGLVERALQHAPPLLIVNPPRDWLNSKDIFCASLRGELAGVLRVKSAALSPGSEGAQLRALGIALTHEPALVSELPQPQPPALPVAADTFITDTLGDVLSLLVAGGFQGYATGHSFVIVGPRGSGKSLALRRLSLTAPIRFRSLRVVYISGKHISHSQHPLRKGLLSLLLGLGLRAAREHSSSADPSPSTDSGNAVGVCDVGSVALAVGPPGSVGPATATLRGVSVASQPTASAVGVGELLRHLAREDLRLLVVVDEMEALYELSADCARVLLLELESLVDIDNGRTALLGCSSSSLLYPLVCGGAALHAYLRETHFPVAAQPLPDMNGQKLPLREIPTTSSMDDTLVRDFCRRDADLASRRVVTFALGGNARHLYDAKLPTPLCGSVELYTDTSAYAPCFRKAFPLVLDLLGRLYDILAVDNAALLKGALKAAALEDASVLQRLDLAAVGASDWGLFRPLSSTTVYSIMRVMCAPAALDESVLHTMLDFLHNDTALVVVHRLGPERSDFCVYPSSAFAVLLHVDWLHRHLEAFSATDWTRSAGHSGCNAVHWLLKQSVIAANWHAAAAELSSLVTAVAGGGATR